MRAQSCPTLCDPTDCSPAGSSVRGILQLRTLEWVAISYSKGSSWSRDQTRVSCISCIGRWHLYLLHHLFFNTLSTRMSRYQILKREALGSSQVETWTSENFSCCLREVRTPFKLQGALQDSTRVAAGDRGLISSWGGKLRVPLHFRTWSWWPKGKVGRLSLRIS